MAKIYFLEKAEPQKTFPTQQGMCTSQKITLRDLDGNSQYAERVTSRGHKSPLKMMPRRFTFTEFAKACGELSTKTNPMQTLWTYKNRGLVTQDGATYIIADEFCRKYGIS